MSGAAPVLVVVAKAPVPGRAKTRLTPPLAPEEAADLAAAALLDTLDAVTAASGALARATGTRVRPVVALAGDVTDAARAGALREALDATDVVRQRGDTFAARLVAAHEDAAARLPGHGTLQVGMDTPQVGARALVDAARRLAAPRTDAVLGPAEDGGWWALGLRDPRAVTALHDVPTSRDDTGTRTYAALTAAGLRTRPLPTARDVDAWEDALAVAATAPGTRFAAAVRALTHDGDTTAARVGGAA